MLISIFSDTDFDLIRRCLAVHNCQRLQADGGWQRGGATINADDAMPQLLIIDIASAGLQLSQLLQQASLTPALPVLLLAGDDAAAIHTLSALTGTGGIGVPEIEFKPLRRHALAARVKLLLQRVYPQHVEQQWQEFAHFRFESPACRVHTGGQHVTLTQKEFALAILLFSHLNRPLSRAYLQEAVWGHDSQDDQDDDAPTRTIDTHISRVRNKLKLRPEHGFRLSTVYGYGYQLEQLQQA